MTETAIMREILCAVSALEGALFWRQNTGVFRSLNGREVVRCGIPGMADLGGCYLGKSIQIEVKTTNGVLSKEQKRWKDAVQRAGGIFIEARNPADALTVLAALAIDAHERPSSSSSTSRLDGPQSGKCGSAVSNPARKVQS